jgi:hypothetical protein
VYLSLHKSTCASKDSFSSSDIPNHLPWGDV